VPRLLANGWICAISPRLLITFMTAARLKFWKDRGHRRAKGRCTENLPKRTGGAWSIGRETLIGWPRRTTLPDDMRRPGSSHLMVAGGWVQPLRNRPQEWRSCRPPCFIQTETGLRCTRVVYNQSKRRLDLARCGNDRHAGVQRVTPFLRGRGSTPPAKPRSAYPNHRRVGSTESCVRSGPGFEG
jgi:hypothetical protein